MADAEAFFEKYKGALPTLFHWIDTVQSRARRNGTISTFFGRPRRVRGYYENHNAGFANRTATNTQIQGCHVYDNLVLTDKGYRKIGELYDEFISIGEDMSRWGYKVCNGFEWCEFFPVDRGVDIKYKLHFSNGQNTSVIECDSRHKVKVLRDGLLEWVYVNNLIDGEDKVAFMKNSDFVRFFDLQSDVGKVSNPCVDLLDTEEDYDYMTIVRVENTGESVDTYTLCVLNFLHQYVCEGMISKNTASDILKITMCKLWKNLLNNPKYKA